jgi:ABC-2 type transport system ATP-binding protein
MTTPLLSLHGCTRLFAGGAGMRDVDLDVLPGEIHAVVGLNGAGKSTLMRVALGMLVPSAGEVRVAGEPLASMSGHIWSGVGHLIENPLAYGGITVRRNLEIGARLRGVSPGAVGQVVDAAVERLGIAAYAGVESRRLSLGNRQRLGLAVALLADPVLLVLDEPTNALDPSGVLLLREALLERAGAGAGVLVSSHHLDEVARVATRISVMNAGRVVGSLDPATPEIERAFFALVLADDQAQAATTTVVRGQP